MDKLVLLRHGKSVRNEERRFTRWPDAGLTWKHLDIPTEQPLACQPDSESKPVRGCYLDNEAAIEKAMDTVANKDKSH